MYTNEIWKISPNKNDNFEYIGKYKRKFNCLGKYERKSQICSFI